MTDETLLAIPDWHEMTDRQLKRAVNLAKRRGRQTAELLVARMRERELPDNSRYWVANFELYLAHCVTHLPDSKEWARQWGEKNAMEACDDPRLAWFCVVFQRVNWRLMGNATTKPPSLLTLQKIRDHQFEQVSRAQYRLSMQVSMIHQQGGSIHDPEAAAQIIKLKSAFMAHIDYAMLAVMTLNVRTDEWIEEKPGCSPR
jgi:hypothetical protein